MKSYLQVVDGPLLKARATLRVPDGTDSLLVVNLLDVQDQVRAVQGENGEAFLKAGIFGLAGTRLTLQGNIEIIDGSLMHGRYTGSLDGQPVVMDQYLEMRNDVLTGLVRVVTAVQGSAPVPIHTNIDYVQGLLDDVAMTTDPTLAKD